MHEVRACIEKDDWDVFPNFCFPPFFRKKGGAKKTGGWKTNHFKKPELFKKP
jgi:hypothetical protein